MSAQVKVTPEAGFDYSALDWSAEKAQTSLNQVYREMDHDAVEISKWYRGKKEKRKFWSIVFHGLALIFLGLGLLCPIVAGFGDSPVEGVTSPRLLISQLGYAFLAVSGGVVWLDRMVGATSSWIRFMETAQIVEKDLNAFRLDWTKLSCELGGQTPSKAQTAEFLKMAREFQERIRRRIAEETKAWALEYRAGRIQLENLVLNGNGSGGEPAKESDRLSA